MAPNLCLAVMKAIRPWTWFPRQKEKVKEEVKEEVKEDVKEVKLLNQLHYQSEPIPGIYLVNQKRRYLVATKQNGNTKYARKLFKQNATLTRHEAAVYMMEEEATYSTWSLNSTAMYRTTSQVCTAGSFRSTITPSSMESVGDECISKKRNVQFVLPVPQPRRDPYNPTPRPYRKSPLQQCQNAEAENKTSSLALSRFPGHLCNVSHKSRCDDECPPRSIDMVGFRYLEHPLEVEFSPYLERWIFTAELKMRTIVRFICPYGRHRNLDKSVFGKLKLCKQFTCLDDGVSWLLTGDVNKLGEVKQRENVVRDNSDLYCRMKTGMMRKLNDTECQKRRIALEKSEGRLLKLGSMPGEYGVVVKYIGRRAKLVVKST